MPTLCIYSIESPVEILTSPLIIVIVLMIEKIDETMTSSMMVVDNNSDEFDSKVN